MDSYTWTCQCWLTRKILYSLALCRHWMPSRVQLLKLTNIAYQKDIFPMFHEPVPHLCHISIVTSQEDVWMWKYIFHLKCPFLSSKICSNTLKIKEWGRNPWSDKITMTHWNNKIRFICQQQNKHKIVQEDKLKEKQVTQLFGSGMMYVKVCIKWLRCIQLDREE